MKQPKEYSADLKSDPSGFRQKARKHQSDYRQNVLRVDCSYPYGSRLTETDGFEKGLNFYEGLCIRDAVKAKSSKYKEALYSNLLRSEHVPFNFFIPIQTFKNEVRTLSFLNRLVPGLKAESITNFSIEYAPKKGNYLKDNTLFDTYIETKDANGEKTGLGIEVKYTERSYPYGETEKNRTFDLKSESPYHLASKFAGIKDESIELLRQEDLKQFWRNYLLGVTMVREKLIEKFVSVHFYPSGNIYQHERAKAFEKLLPEDNRFSFLPITYESFIEHGRNNWAKEPEKLQWLAYLEERYIVK